jgi:hypothetical protein
MSRSGNSEPHGSKFLRDTTTERGFGDAYSFSAVSGIKNMRYYSAEISFPDMASL